MPSSRPKLMTYTTDEVIEKFKIVSEADNRSMSKELEYIVKECSGATLRCAVQANPSNTARSRI